MSEMTNAEITAEFEELFGGGTEPDEEEVEDQEDSEEAEESENESEETENEEDASEDEESEEEEQEEDKSEDESGSQKKTPPASDKAKANHAFAEQRLQIKKNERFIRDLGKLIGFDEKASVEDIQNKIKEALIEKDAKDNNISVDLARRLDAYESDKEELARVKLEKKVQEDFSELIDRHNLDKDAVDEFTNYLIENGKNPMLDSTVDLESEYLKLHYDDMVKAAVAEALAKEAARQKKAEEKAASGVSKGASDKGDAKITSVKELDDLFNGLDI